MSAAGGWRMRDSQAEALIRRCNPVEQGAKLAYFVSNLGMTKPLARSAPFLQ